MTIADLNKLPAPALKNTLELCCGSSAWVEQMIPAFPVTSLGQLLAEARRTWYACTEQDWLEAFTHHPKIGDVASLKKKFAAAGKLAAAEQASVSVATDETLSALAEGNRLYEEKFGYIFIVCATGKSAGEMLSLLNLRLTNECNDEMKIAMEEQCKITEIRLTKLIDS